jgi:RNA polymerase sigma factor (TIGR02999 family)
MPPPTPSSAGLVPDFLFFEGRDDVLCGQEARSHEPRFTESNPTRDPMSDESTDITVLLNEMTDASPAAVNLLFGRLYDELRAIAARRLAAERGGHTLSATALVNEAYLKLSGLEELQWRNRAQFFAIAARAMRRILVSHARERSAAKRGGGAEHVTLTAAVAPGEGDQAMAWADLMTIEAALTELASLNVRQSRIAEMRIFGGMTHEEIAEALGVSVPTVERDWRIARAMLGRALG